MRALTLLCLLASSCYCWQSAHVQEPKCVIAHEAVACTEQILGAAFAALAPVVGSWMNGQPMDWTVVEQAAESLGLRDGGCFLSALAGDLASKNIMKRPAMRAEEISAALTRLKQHFGVSPSTSFVMAK